MGRRGGVRLLHISDVHCSYSQVQRLAEKLAASGFYAILISGDIECPDLVLEPLIRSGTRIYAVPGNMDDVYVKDYLSSRGINVDGRLIDLDGFVLAGIGGIDPYGSLRKVVSELGGRPRSKLIVLSHHPPFGTKVDRAFRSVHAGLRELRRFVEEYEPVLVLCGHIHESRGSDVVGRTVVVNPGPLAKGFYATVSLPELKVELSSL